MMSLKKPFVFLIFTLLLQLVGCGGINYAPVFDGQGHVYHTTNRALTFRTVKGYDIAKHGDNIHSLAFKHQKDPEYLSKINQQSRQAKIQPGKVIRIDSENSSDTQAQSSLVIPPNPEQINTRIKGSGSWLWPTSGKVIQKFAPSTGNKGINITNKLGTPIKATAAGVVVYEGQGLEGYGKLIIIKHDTGYLSAYAHNAQVFVHEGEKIKAGEKIATMGSTGSNKVMLHFEIRKGGQPIDPLSVLN